MTHNISCRDTVHCPSVLRQACPAFPHHTTRVDTWLVCPLAASAWADGQQSRRAILVGLTDNNHVGLSQ
eukprot:332623-Chlamydomonas_euryale.AAC.2